MKKKSKIIPYSTQNINSSDIKSVLDTLQSGFLSQGHKNLEFEQEMAKLTNSKYLTIPGNRLHRFKNINKKRSTKIKLKFTRKKKI